MHIKLTAHMHVHVTSAWGPAVVPCVSHLLLIDMISVLFESLVFRALVSLLCLHGALAPLECLQALFTVRAAIYTRQAPWSGRHPLVRS